MDNAHVAFITLPHSPHVYPTLPIVSSLIRRGYRVTYATSDRFSSEVENLGAEVALCSKLEFQSSTTDDDGPPVEEAFVDFTKGMLEKIAPFYESNRPDLILYDFMAFAGRILTKRLGVPAIQTSPFYVLDEHDFEGQVKHKQFREGLVWHGSVIARFLRGYDVASNNYRTDKEKLNILLFPQVLQPKGTVLGNDCFFAGRCAAERVVESSWSDHSDGRPIALVAMSTILATLSTATQVPEHFKFCIETLSQLGWHVVLAVGERCNSSALMPLPAHCEIVHHKSYLKVLSRARLLFFMSGIISTAEAAYHGVPMIAVTNGVAEFEWQAEHIVELGIGTHVRKEDTNAESLKSAAIHLSGDAWTQRRVREVKYLVRREPGAEETANRIEDYLGARSKD